MTTVLVLIIMALIGLFGGKSARMRVLFCVRNTIGMGVSR